MSNKTTYDRFKVVYGDTLLREFFLGETKLKNVVSYKVSCEVDKPTVLELKLYIDDFVESTK